MRRGLFFLFFIGVLCSGLVPGMATELVASSLSLHLSNQLNTRPNGVPTSGPLPLSLPMTLTIERHKPRFIFPEKMDPKPYLRAQDSILKTALFLPLVTTTVALEESPLPDSPSVPDPVPDAVAVTKNEAKFAGFSFALIPAGVGLLLFFSGIYLSRRRATKKPRLLRLDKDRPQPASPEHPVLSARQVEIPLLSHSEAFVEKKAKAGEKTTSVVDWLDSIPPYTERVRAEFGRLILKLDTPKIRGGPTLFSRVSPIARKGDNGGWGWKNKAMGLSIPPKPVETMSLPSMHKERLQKKYRKGLLPFSWRKSLYKSLTAKYPTHGIPHIKQGKSTVRRPQEGIQYPVLGGMGGEVGGGDKESLQKLSGAQRGIALSAYRKTSNN